MVMARAMRVPHPIPYQGSKRQLAPTILRLVGERRFSRLYEPLAGSAAITIRAAASDLADQYLIGDKLGPLVEIWNAILTRPEKLADEYRHLWLAPSGQSREHFARVRERFNQTGDPASLLYLLARCVKNSPRFNQEGEFNQSPDLRRRGMHPDKMRAEILGAHGLLSGRTRTFVGDFRDAIADATSDDLVYLDPPWQGTSTGRDRRYYEGLERGQLVAALEDLNRRAVPFILSYDGQCGSRRYGEPLPASLGLRRIELVAGRSAQATLNGRNEVTVESLYLSSRLGDQAGLPQLERRRAEAATRPLVLAKEGKGQGRHWSCGSRSSA